jgi:outer membrane protein OmpA-like peptidoglycan-associated protein
MDIMRKYFWIYTLLFSVSFSFSQNLFVVIKGRVTASGKWITNVPCKNVKLRLAVPTGEMREATTDSAGNYSFRIRNNVDSVMLEAWPDRMSSFRGQKRSEIIHGGSAINLRIDESDTISQDINLGIGNACSSFPSIEFYYNSIKMTADTNWDGANAQAAINMLISMMNENPKIVIELSGHCDVREKPQLAQQRAEAVLAELTKKGIDKKRMVAKGYGSTQPIFTGKQVNLAKTKEEKESMYQKNRRVTFKVIRFEED